MKIFVASICMLLVSGVAVAQDITAKDFDLACAVTASAEIATTQKGTKERDAAFTVFTFYLGRLSARDDKTFWGAVVKGRIAEMREKAKSESVYGRCMDFYVSKME
jgi:hypothetical protein